MRTKFKQLYGESFEDIDIQVIEMKKVVIYTYGIHIACSVAEIKILAPTSVLNHLLTDGLGSLCGSGFGMLERIG